ncbi:MAG: cation/H(+) antiporter [Flavobacterium sp. BFFFF2]|nr:MAG: cation/H(+) antiporter [Flavobacterium sp. BFFFF2]
MRNLKNTLFYFIVTGGFIAIMYWIVGQGKALEVGRSIILPSSKDTQWMQFLSSLFHNFKHPMALLMAQIITIVLVARCFGWIFRKIGQPTVIGEIIAGIVLGPSLFGLYFPDLKTALFPVESLGNLQILSQVGLILFMFVIGMELDLKVLKNKANDAVVISHASIVIPFAMGIGLSYFIYHQFAPENVEFLSFSLFMGIAMSITAFPVLARIVQERGIHKTRLGTIVITCAAADDITAWCLLAAVIAIVKAGSFVSSLYIIGLAIFYVAFMLLMVKPFLKRLGDLFANRETLSKPVVAIFFLTLLVSAYMTEVIGIHALFGAFMAGAIMPDQTRFRSLFIEKVEDVAVIILLPLFFVFTGLRTEIGLINDPYLWKVTGFIILVAVAGKFLGSALAAKFVGQTWRDSLTIGALMNTRGLMELVVLNIGYELGVLSPKIFTMMVIMALVTTFMTGPALDLIGFIFKSKSPSAPDATKDEHIFKILLSFGNNEKGKSLLRLAHSLTRKHPKESSVTAMHLVQSDDMHAYNLEEYEKDTFAPLLATSQELNMQMHPLFKATGDIETDIADTAMQGEFDLVLVGLGKSLFEGTLLGKVLGFTTRIINPDRLLDKFTGKEGLFENSPFDDRTRLIISKTKTPLGILIDKELQQVMRICVPIYSQGDTFLMDYAQRFIENNDANLALFDLVSGQKSNFTLDNALKSLESRYPGRIQKQAGAALSADVLAQNDLLLVSLESWKRMIDAQKEWLPSIPSVLIIKP